MIKQYLKIVLPIFLIVILQSCATPGKKPKSVHGEKPLIDTAEIIAITANSNFPSKANLIEVNPIQTPISVSMLGKITLAFFFSATTLKLFFGLSIIIF